MSLWSLAPLWPSGKKNKLRVYYLSWLRNKILHNDPEVEKKQGWTTVGDLEGAVHYKVGTLTQGPGGYPWVEEDANAATVRGSIACVEQGTDSARVRGETQENMSIDFSVTIYWHSF